MEYDLIIVNKNIAHNILGNHFYNKRQPGMMRGREEH